MTTVTEIIEAVKKLPQVQKDEFLERLRQLELDDVWDRQIDADARAGKLDRFIAEAIQEHKDGHRVTRPAVPGPGTIGQIIGPARFNGLTDQWLKPMR